MATATDTQQLLDQQVQLIDEGAFDRLEELWLDQMSRIPSTNDFFKPWLTAIKRSGALDRGESLIVMLAENHLEARKPKEALRVLLLALPTFPASEALRPLLIQALRGQFGRLEQIDSFIHLSGLEKEGASLVAAYKQFREWTHLAPGQVYSHYDWGEGVVQELDLAGNRVVLDFPREQGKTLTIEGARKFLTWIEPKHFLARRAKDPESLQQLADDRPAEIVKQVLSGQTDMEIKQSDLKSLLLGQVISEKGWNTWWGKAREELAIDPYVDFDRSGGARATIRLRRKPRTFAQEIADGFFDPDVSTAGRVELIRQLAKRPKDASLPAAIVERMTARLQEEWALVADDGPVARLEVAYMMQDLAQAVPDAAIDPPDAGEILDDIEDYRVLFDVDHHDYGARALVHLMHRDGDEGVQQAARLLPSAPVKMAQAIWEAMEEDHHSDLGVGALQKLFDNPLENPDTFAWALRATLDGSWRHLEDYFPAQAMIPELIEQMERWQSLAEDATHPRDRREAAKKLVSRGRTLLGADHCELISLAVEEMPREMANRLRRQIQAHPAFNAAFKAQAERAISVTRRDLEEGDESPQAAAASAADALFYCTPRAQAKAMAELREITSVLIPKNAKVIEEARMEGDLRENAGYQYAKEEQKMLVQKQATISDLLGRARVIRGDEVDAKRIGFGTRFRVHNQQTGEEETYTLLGRWEADPERNILSEQAPLARQFAGRQAGEKLRIERPGAPATDYEVLAIENAIAGSEWESAEV